MKNFEQETKFLDLVNLTLRSEVKLYLYFGKKMYAQETKPSTLGYKFLPYSGPINKKYLDIVVAGLSGIITGNVYEETQ
jgi:hypothetical protein